MPIMTGFDCWLKLRAFVNDTPASPEEIMKRSGVSRMGVQFGLRWASCHCLVSETYGAFKRPNGRSAVRVLYATLKRKEPNAETEPGL